MRVFGPRYLRRFFEPPREETFLPALRAVDVDDVFRRPLDFVELFLLAGRRALDFAPRELRLVARDFAEAFEPPRDFLDPEVFFDPDRLRPPEVLRAAEDFRPRVVDDFFALPELRRAPLFLLDDDFLVRMPAARLAAPAASVAAALAVATFLGLPAALPAIAPINPPTTAPTGPATLPTTAPAAAPAVVLEIDGISRLSEEEGVFCGDC